MILGFCKKITGVFSHSSKRRIRLTSAQAELNLPQHSLKTDCSTRWSSTYAMMVRILEQQEAIKRVLIEDKKLSHLLAEWWEKMEDCKTITQALETYASLTDALSGEKHVTISSILPLVYHISSLAEETEPETEADGAGLTVSGIENHVRSKVADYMVPRFGEPELLQYLGICTTLDPRYKEYLKNHKKEQYEAVKSLIINEAVSNRQEPPAALPDQTSAAAPASKSKCLGDILMGIASPPSTSCQSDLTSLSIITKEFELFISSAPLAIKSADTYSDPLEWWRINTHCFPNIHLLARKYLCSCATSVSSERLFSTSGNIITLKRNKLSPTMANMLVFLASNSNTD